MPLGIIGFVFFILNGLLDLIALALIISAVLSWLIAFNILNTRNPGIYRLMDVLDRFTAPILEPFRRLIPPVGGFDLSFVVALLVIRGMQMFLLPAAEGSLAQLVSM